MNFKEFFKSILPGLSPNTVQSDLDSALQEYFDHVEPVYERFVDEFKELKLKSSYGSRFDKVYRNRFTKVKDTNFVTDVFERALKNIPASVALVQGSLEENFKAELAKSAMSARQINAVQLSELMSFTVRYSRRLLNLVVTAETQKLLDKPEEGKLKKGEINWIVKHYSAFLNAVAFLRIPHTEAESMLESIPDFLVQENQEQEAETLAGIQADPFNMQFVPLVLNPIYHFGMRVAEWQAARYHEAIAEQQALEAKIVFLKKRLDGETDAGLQEVIERYDELLSKKSYEIAKLEDKYVKS